jgi:alkaline phosphatase
MPVIYMKNLIRITFSFVFFSLCIAATAQLKNYSVENAHSHNDYLNATPFYLAFNNGFNSIEADVFPVDGVLYVAHNKVDIQLQNTLQNLYINPLLHKFVSDSARKLRLLVDIKEKYEISLPLLIKELEPLKKYFSTLEKPNYLTIIITGDRPPPAAYKDYPNFIFFDDDLKLLHTAKEWCRVALVSLPFYKISVWNGKDSLGSKDKEAIHHIIDSVHTAGKPIRFWAAPDTEASWKWQMKLGADLIGTDKINELGNFLRRKVKN